MLLILTACFLGDVWWYVGIRMHLTCICIFSCKDAFPCGWSVEFQFRLHLYLLHLILLLFSCWIPGCCKVLIVFPCVKRCSWCCYGAVFFFDCVMLPLQLICFGSSILLFCWRLPLQLICFGRLVCGLSGWRPPLQLICSGGLFYDLFGFHLVLLLLGRWVLIFICWVF